MASWYRTGIRAVMDGSVNLLTSEIKVSLVKSTYNPSATHSSFATSVAGNETSGTGYSAKTLSGKTVDLDEKGRATFDAADAVWSGLTADFRYVVIYSGDVLLGWLDLGAQSVVNKDMTLKWENYEQNIVTGESTLFHGLLRGITG